MHRLVRLRLSAAGHDHRPLTDYLRILEAADLVLATGMGGITDVFPGYAYELLETLDSAHRLGAVTAMMGQGMGPIDDCRLRRYAETCSGAWISSRCAKTALGVHCSAAA